MARLKAGAMPPNDVPNDDLNALLVWILQLI
jgi:hypothetical protein